MHSLIEDMHLSWIIFGDLNKVTKEEDKLGGRCFYKKILYLKPVMELIGAKT